MGWHAFHSIPEIITVRHSRTILATLCVSVGFGLLPPGCLVAQQVADMTSPNLLSAEESAQGFRQLFDGSSTRGWRGYRLPSMPAGWAAVDGALTRVSQTSDIITIDEFENFELRLSWRIPEGGNSGIMYHVTEEGDAIYTSGPEYQVLDDARHPDGRNRLTSAGSLFGLYAPPEGIVKPAGEWNDARIIVRGAHVEHWLNGVKVVEYELWSPEWRAKVQASKFSQWPEYGLAHRGHIALQGDHDGAVAYRSIRIRPLP
jgi:hypothetical protein